MYYELYKLRDKTLYLCETDKSITNNEHLYRDYRTNYDSFFDYWKTIIGDESRVVDFRLKKNILYIKTIYFDKDSWDYKEGIIKLDRRLIEDSNFMLMINALVIKFKKVKEKTLKNIENKKNTYFEREKMEAIALGNIRLFCEKGELRELGELDVPVQEYIEENKKRLLKFFISYKGLSIKIKVLLSIGLGVLSFPLVGFGSVYLVPLIYGIACIFETLYDISKRGKRQEEYLARSHEVTSGIPSQQTTLKRKLQETKDQFLDFILEDYKYIEAHIEGEFRDLFKDLKRQFNDLNGRFNLLKKYEIVYGTRMSKSTILNELVFLEMQLYGKANTRGFKEKRQITFGMKHVVERLAYLGFSLDDDLANNYIKAAKNTLNRILSLPYEGCEKDILKVLQLLIHYMSMHKNEIDFLRELSSIDDLVTEKINEAFAIEEKEDGLTATSLNNENQKTM